MSETTPETQPTDTPTTEETTQPSERTFTQADVDRIVADRLSDDRRRRDLKPEQVRQLKAETEEAKANAATMTERLEAVERDLASARREAEVARTQARHGISDDDAKLFLTGTTTEELEAQAARLAAMATPAKESFGNPRVGNLPHPPIDETTAFLRDIAQQL